MPWPYFGVPRLMEVLNQQCRGAEPCQILCHSTGCPITGYVLDHNPGYNISSVVNLAGASGGSELATLAAWIKNLLGPLQWIAELINGQGNYFLIPGVTRALYDHNDTSGVPISVVVGSKGEWYSWAVFPGKNDGVVAFHSSAGYVKAFSADVVSGATEFCWKTGQSCWRAWWGHTYCVSYPYPSSCGVARWNNHFLQSGMPNGGYGQYNHGEVGRTQSLYHR
ncbi:MAG: hypothetical protein HY042_01970 [Spirochaetia bacterium]|nr:hypothetical protein [Spirochaetia bacterium]